MVLSGSMFCVLLAGINFSVSIIGDEATVMVIVSLRVSPKKSIKTNAILWMPGSLMFFLKLYSLAKLEPSMVQ